MKLYKLTKNELIELLIQAIGRRYEQTSFFPYKIVSANFNLPENIEIGLELIPKGMKENEVIHYLNQEN